MTALPKDFVAYCHDNFDDADALIVALDTDAPTSIRINTNKIKAPELQSVKWCHTGYYLPQRPIFTEDPWFHAGTYYVQEASSMLISQVSQLLESDAPIKILDLCAAPGGKTTLLLDLFPNALVVANEIISKRAKVLGENITKWGTKNCIVTNASPEQISNSKEQFDLILVDAPCSGEGMFRKDLNARKEWSKDNVALCTMRQQDIISTINDNLKQGGILIYSTCTFNQQENEENVDFFMREFGMQALDVTVPSEVTKLKYGYGMYPHKINGEGFFCTFLKKIDDGGKPPKKVKLNKSIQRFKEDPHLFSTNLDQKDLWVYNDVLHAFNHRFIDTLYNLQQSSRIVQFGHKLGKVLKSKFIPDGSVYTLPEIKDLFPSVEVTHDQAIQYLKKEDIDIPGDLKDGWYFVSFHGISIGLIKKIGHRTNNYFPKEWRIINPGIKANFSIARI